ncbi:MAG: 5-(carboxyamino)imidazole ribonucleotide synthase [Micropruina sp.]
MTRAFTIGIIGGGQLARMMHASSIGLGVRIALLAEGPDVSAAQVVADVTVGDYTDPATVAAFAERCDVITFDHEHVPNRILTSLVGSGLAVHPGPDALLFAQDKAAMRQRLSAMGIPCPIFAVVDTADALADFGQTHGWPVIAKTSRGGYDGKGVWKLDSADEVAEPFANLKPGVQIVAEEFIPFARELSALVARRPSGEAVAYPISESVQTAGICTATLTPAPGLTPEQEHECRALALRIADELGVTGILAVELMQRTDGSVVVNELAMRPHNTGHWSIDGARTSQFENHLRAVADLPLGPTEATDQAVVMVNVLGGSVSDLVAALGGVLAADPGVRVQLYGKDVVPGRKVGHVTVTGDELEQVTARARAAAAALMGGDDE